MPPVTFSRPLKPGYNTQEAAWRTSSDSRASFSSTWQPFSSILTRQPFSLHSLPRLLSLHSLPFSLLHKWLTDVSPSGEQPVRCCQASLLPYTLSMCVLRYGCVALNSMSNVISALQTSFCLCVFLSLHVFLHLCVCVCENLFDRKQSWKLCLVVASGEGGLFEHTCLLLLVGVSTAASAVYFCAFWSNWITSSLRDS